MRGYALRLPLDLILVARDAARLTAVAGDTRVDDVYVDPFKTS